MRDSRIDWHPHPFLPHEVGTVSGVVVARCGRTMAEVRPYRAALINDDLVGSADSATGAKMWLQREFTARLARRLAGEMA